jgi:1-pyrroline-5-carboxylate dehydrogenase
MLPFLNENQVSPLPKPANQPVLAYAPGSAERDLIEKSLKDVGANCVDMPLIIDGKAVRTGQFEAAVVPHAHRHEIGRAHLAGPAEIESAIGAANRARKDWSRWPWTDRAAIFLRAAELLSGKWRFVLNAATMLGQSKTVHQAEIDAAAELIDFWRFNCTFMHNIYSDQPISTFSEWNRVDYRPLDGFVLAITPFNFTSIAGNLTTAPALMGNTVIWKPSATAKLAAHYIMELLREAGLPDGVINLVYGDPARVSQLALTDGSFAGLHFTGSTAVFSQLSNQISQNVGRYRSYPRVVGETGGKNFIVVHASADLAAATTAIIRGGFEYQGQKCSAASRIFVAESIWPQLRDRLCDEIGTIAVGPVSDFRNFMGAVIDERAWLRHQSVIQFANESSTAKVLAGGQMDKSEGYFVRPTLIETNDGWSRLMTEEYFGPIVAIQTYRDRDFEDCLELINDTSRYGLTGSIFATDRLAIARAASMLRNAAGNFYVNDKPTGAVVGQQPFGGGRASGTNDKAGSVWNLMRWTSPRSIKENFNPPITYGYPYMS